MTHPRRRQTVADVGCGAGFYTLPLAKLVGPDGKVIALDLQPKMLDLARRRAERRGLDGTIEFRVCEAERLGLARPVDFVLAFWMVHEVVNRRAFFEEIAAAMRPAGRLLVVEPKVHVSERRFHEIVESARMAGLSCARRANLNL